MFNKIKELFAKDQRDEIQKAVIEILKNISSSGPITLRLELEDKDEVLSLELKAKVTMK